MNPIEQCWAVLKMKVWQAEAKAPSSTMQEFKQRCQNIGGGGHLLSRGRAGELLQELLQAAAMSLEKLIANEGKQVA